MTLPHNTPPTRSNSWLHVINSPHWISHREFIQLTFQPLYFQCAPHTAAKTTTAKDVWEEAPPFLPFDPASCCFLLMSWHP